MVLRLLRLLRVAGALFGRQVCVSAHSDGLATGSSSHVSVLRMHTHLFASVSGVATEAERLGKLTRMAGLAA